jgi:uncharacterized repeat protein (TIGR03803 family)
MLTLRHTLTTGGTLVTAFLIFNGYIAAQSPPRALTTLYSFMGGSDGYIPAAVAVSSGPSGNPILYGVSNGGTSNFGTVFSLAQQAAPVGTWNKTVLYNFTGGTSDGIGPNAVAVGGGGVVYGTTSGGGANRAGIVFSLTPPAAAGDAWTETVLYNFAAGLSPAPGLAIDSAPGGFPVLYGTTYRGGSSNLGTVYSLAPAASPSTAWTQAELYSFNGAPGDGATPLAGVAIGSGPGGRPVLYGTTGAGGVHGGGTVFSLTPPTARGGPWSETALANFVYGDKTVFRPAAPVLIDGGVLFGTLEYGGYSNCAVSPTPAGCGGIYAVTLPVPPGGATVDVLYKFSPSGPDTDAQNPTTGMVMGLGGILYGVTYHGGYSNLGALYSFTPPTSPGGAWTEALVHSFSEAGAAGNLPGGVVSDPGNGVIYGTTGYGGASNSGTVFSYTP